MGQLDNRIALVTGGSSGIGLATARCFVDEGALVYLTGRREAELNAAAESIGERAVAVPGDVADLASLDALFATIRERSGRLDVVFANAGGGGLAPLARTTEKDFDRAFDINVKGVLFTVQKALPLLPDGASVILNCSTNAGRGVRNMGVYNATKAAVRSLARTWAAELASRGIRVNAVSPGPIETPAVDSLAGDEPRAQRKFRDGLVESIPMRRIGRADEVAAMLLFLATDQSSFTTGSELFVDGGVNQI